MEVPLALVALVIQFPRGFNCPYNGGLRPRFHTLNGFGCLKSYYHGLMVLG